MNLRLHKPLLLFIVIALFQMYSSGQKQTGSQQKLNQYLKDFDNGYYGYFEIKDGYIWLRFKSGNYNKFRMEDMEGAVIQAEYQRVIFKCKDGAKCISTDWKPNGREEYMQFIQNSLSYDYTVLAGLLNQFRDDCLLSVNGKDKIQDGTEWVDEDFDALAKSADSLKKGVVSIVAQKKIPRARIIDVGKTYTTIVRVPNCLNWVWASPEQKKKSDEDNWNGYKPAKGDVGDIIYKTTHCDSKITIVILKIGENYIPVAEDGIKYLED